MPILLLFITLIAVLLDYSHPDDMPSSEKYRQECA